MTAGKVRYPGPGCVVEFMQGNSPMLALVLEEQGGKLRLYTQNRRETNLPAARLLPWSGPGLGAGLSRQAMDSALEEHRQIRDSLSSGLDLEELWDLTQDEMGKASVEWLAGLVWKETDIDREAALGRALLSDKTRFRFSPPDFEIFPRDVVEQRAHEAEQARLREAVVSRGAGFFQVLWDISTRKRGPLSLQETPEPSLAELLRDILMRRMADPESGGEGFWKPLTKGLPDVPHLALLLASAWGLVPEHYNVWLDRADFERGEEWALAFAGECQALTRRYEAFEAPELEEPLVSVDPEGSHDRDDAFFVRALPDGGFRLLVAVACPSAVWPFGSPLDKAALRRAASLYLPEGDEHMLPPRTGWQLFSLDEGVSRVCLAADMLLDSRGECTRIEPRLARVRLAANLGLEECEAVLGQDGEGFAGSEKASAMAPMLRQGLELARRLQARRLDLGAVVIERPDPKILLKEGEEGVRVLIEDPPQPGLATMLVSEIMVACNAALARWAADHGIPLIYRTQDVALPREYAGVWNQPQDIYRVVRLLPASTLESQPRRHAGLGLPAYATITSPIRRYVDLLNQGQITHFLRTGSPRMNLQEIQAVLPLISARQEAATQVQRFRPRYWKLLFFRQQGDKQWWDAVVADENDAFVTVSLPWAQLMLRGRRRLFAEKTYAGQSLQVRIGKVSPHLNEIAILEAREG